MNQKRNGITWVYVVGFIIVVILLVIGYKVLAVTVGPVRVDFTPPNSDGGDRNPSLPTAVQIPTTVSFPASIDGVWDGAYNCLGGIRNVQLTITDSTTSLMKATFYYYASADSPSTVPGSFQMVGTYDNRTGVVQLETSSPEERHIQAIYGVLSNTGVTFEGTISHSLRTSCSWIRVARTE